MSDRPNEPLTRRSVAIAGHTGDHVTVDTAAHHDDPTIRATAIGALERLGRLSTNDLLRFLDDGSPIVRRRAVEAAARVTDIDLVPLLRDAEPMVVEMAAWSAGEHESSEETVMAALIEVATAHDDPLCREAAVAALGAIGDDRGLPAILVATRDKPAIRRRAVIALAPFDGPDVLEALERAKSDRDKSVRAAATDLG